MRFYVYVEGSTEEAFVGEILAPHLYSLGAHDVRPCLVWTKKDRRRLTKGGGRNWSAASRGLKDLLLDGKEDARFTTMFDLYGLFGDFPGLDLAAAIGNPVKRVEALETALAEDIADRRLIPYIQLHEFEALLFVDCRQIGRYYETPETGTIAQTIVDNSGCPEAINDGPETAPSKRIKELFPQYRKRLDSIAILREVGLAELRRQCPHFNDWISRLETQLNQ